MRNPGTLGRVTSFAAPASRATTGGPVDPSGLARLAAFVFWVVVPVLCLAGIVLGVTTWTVHAHRQVPGIPGSFLVENRSCGGSVCLSTGTFTSDNGAFEAGPLSGGLGWGQDSTHKVVYDASNGSIVPLGARWNPTAAISALSGAAVLLAAWGWLAFGRSDGSDPSRSTAGPRRPHPSTTTGPALA